MKQIYFTPGPSELYFTVAQHIKRALQEQIPSISHRSRAYIEIHTHTVEGLRKLLSIPENYYVAFTPSATEIWERILQSLVERESYHFVNGAFSKRFYEIAKELGKKPSLHESKAGSIPSVQEKIIPASAELISVTQNETSTGVSFPEESISLIKKQYPHTILAVDYVSSIPAVPFDLRNVDTAYFSVQKCFGLPAGLGVWIYNNACIQKAEALASKNISLGSYHTLLKLHEYGQKMQTPSTPNVLNIYLLGKVVEDMLQKGLQNIQRETAYKSALLYNFFDKNKQFTPFVKDVSLMSRTVIVINTKDRTEKLLHYLKTKNMIVGNGYGEFKNKHIRIANFPAISQESVHLLIDEINNFTTNENTL